MKPKHQRLIFVLGALVVMAVATTMILQVFRDNLMYFYTPGMLDAKREETDFDPARRFRLGGLVEPGSIVSTTEGAISFRVSDGTSSYTVTYQGLLPTLFREGQGVVLVGKWAGERTVQAESILAKHDENYMPPEVAEALKASGHWGGKGGTYPALPARE